MLKLFRLKRSSRCRERRGATAVEFTFVIPIFALFCVVCFDFSRLSLARHVVQNAVYRAGRQAMMEGVTKQDTIDSVTNYLNLYGYPPAEGSVIAGQIYLDDNGHVLPVNTANEFDNESVEFYVEATVPFANATLVFPTFFPKWVEDKNITARIQVRSERYSGFFNPAEAYAN